MPQSHARVWLRIAFSTSPDYSRRVGQACVSQWWAGGNGHLIQFNVLRRHKRSSHAPAHPSPFPCPTLQAHVIRAKHESGRGGASRPKKGSSHVFRGEHRSRGAAAAVWGGPICCRRSAAANVFAPAILGLTPKAKRWHRFATGNE